MRVDLVTHAGPERGYGHLMRMLALAEAFEELGMTARFLLPDPWGSEIVAAEGFQCEAVNPEKWRHPWGEPPDLYVIDHYAVSANYFDPFSLRAPVVYIDDLCLEAYPVSAVLNGHFYAETMSYETFYPGALKLMGPRYCLLRKPFWTIGERKPWPVTDILVTTGGTDPQNLMPELVSEVLEGIAAKQIGIHCIIGSGFNDAAALRTLSEKDSRIQLHWHPAHLGDIMACCQLAVSATGTTLYELGALGIAALAWQMVDNQRYVYQSAVAGDLIIPVDPHVAGNLARELAMLLIDEKRVLDLSNRLRSHVDGQGARRAARRLAEFIEEKE